MTTPTTSFANLPAYTTLYRNVRAILFMRGLHTADVDDVAQMVMEKILRASARGMGPSSNANAWVRTIARNEHINWLRRRKRIRECTLETDRDIHTATPCNTDRSHNGATVVFVRDVEGQLTHRQRAVARMFSSGYTGQEIANSLGLSPALISLEKKAIRNTLREMGYANRRPQTAA